MLGEQILACKGMRRIYTAHCGSREEERSSTVKHQSLETCELLSLLWPINSLATIQKSAGPPLFSISLIRNILNLHQEMRKLENQNKAPRKPCSPYAAKDNPRLKGPRKNNNTATTSLFALSVKSGFGVDVTFNAEDFAINHWGIFKVKKESSVGFWIHSLLCLWGHQQTGNAYSRVAA